MYKEAEENELHYVCVVFLLARRAPREKSTAGEGLKGSTPTRIARVLAILLLNRPPSSMADKNYWIPQYHLTGKEYMNILERVNGKAPSVHNYTDEQFHEDIISGEIYPRATSASLLRLWKNGFKFEGEELNIRDDEVSFEELVRQGTKEQWC